MGPLNLLNIACQRCRRRKVKCDLSSPTCGNCARARVECQSTEASSSRAASSLPPGYLESLESEVAKLEHILTNGPQSVGSVAQSDDTDQNGQSQTPYGIDWSLHGDEPCLHPALAWGLKRVLLNVFAFDNSYPFSSKFHRKPFLTTSKPNFKSLTALPRLRQYLDVFITSVHPCLPFINKPTLQAYDPGSDEDTVTIPILMSAAIGALVSPKREELPVRDAIELHEAAVRAFLGENLSPDMETLQALLLATVFSLFSSAGGSTWHLLGHAIQVSAILGLHQQPPCSDNSRSAEKQLECNTFWSLFILDRLVSRTLGRPLGIADRDIRSEYPDSQYVPFAFQALLTSALLVSNLDETKSLKLDWISETSRLYTSLFQKLVATHGDYVLVSLCSQMLVWTSEAPWNLKLNKLPGKNEPPQFSQLTRLWILCLDTRAKYSYPLPWTAAYAMFHVAIVQRISDRLQAIDSQMGPDLSAKRTNRQSWEMTVNSSLDICSQDFTGIAAIHALYAHLMNTGSKQQEVAPYLEAVQNRQIRSAIQMLIGLSIEI